MSDRSRSFPRTGTGTKEDTRAPKRISLTFVLENNMQRTPLSSPADSVRQNVLHYCSTMSAIFIFPHVSLANAIDENGGDKGKGNR